ncbi:MAG: glycosyl transferase family 1, partial [Chloroflexi bacterium]|nr:glycosyl transferase family 1 [Chloroflexota bacterium]
MSRIGFLSTRLAGTDGVSLETAKIATIARRLGHEVFYCAGELDADSPPGMLFPEMHFAHPEARRIHDEAFIGPAPADLRARIAAMAKRL